MKKKLMDLKSRSLGVFILWKLLVSRRGMCSVCFCWNIDTPGTGFVQYKVTVYSVFSSLNFRGTHLLLGILKEQCLPGSITVAQTINQDLILLFAHFFMQTTSMQNYNIWQYYSHSAWDEFSFYRKTMSIYLHSNLKWQ